MNKEIKTFAVVFLSIFTIMIGLVKTKNMLNSSYKERQLKKDSVKTKINKNLTQSCEKKEYQKEKDLLEVH